MNLYSFSITVLMITLGMLITSQTVQARLYRWVDERGNIFYSDKVPPEYNKLRREALNDKARVIEVKEAEKPKEQKILEMRLQKLREEQEKIIAEREAQDKVLLSTFRSEEDMLFVLQRTLQSIEAKKKVSEADLQRLEFQVQAQQKEAAGYELEGKPVPEKLLAEIKGTEKQMQSVEIEIDRHLQRMQHTKDTFSKDRDRFVFLKKKLEKDLPDADKMDEGLIPATKLGLFVCHDEKHCNAAWDIARLFVQKQSTTSIELDSKNLIMTEEPLLDSDISLSLSRIKDVGGKIQIFLDIRCRTSEIGDAFCKSAKVHGLRSAFTHFIETQLAAD